ncbi:hypothetical protein K3495_g3240 [Podosphaera aphanis]|nr:hypothetical protein K3495_g3240 [Podosphaera aphanis]
MEEILKALRFAPKLNKSTFIRWSFLVEQVLKNLHVDKYILKNDGVPPLSTKDEKEIFYHDQDGNIKVAIAQLVPEELFYLIHGKPTSKDMWDALVQHYRPMTQDSIASLLQDFWGFTVDSIPDVDKFAEELIVRQTKISSIDFNQRLGDQLMKSRLLGHLDRCCDGYFSGTVTVLRNDNSISFSGAVSLLRATQASYENQFSNGAVSLVRENINNPQSPSPREQRICAFCNRKNHTRETCFLWIDTPDGSKWAAKNPQKASIALKLKERFSKKSKSETPNEPSINGAWVVEEQILSSVERPRNLDVILDTGATHHIFHDRTLFTSFYPVNKSVQTASGHIATVAAVGSVSFTVYNFQDSSRTKVIRIDDVWYLPSCTKNLVSGLQLLSKGLQIHSRQHGLSVLSSNGIVLATARLKNGLFSFNTSPPEPAPDTPNSTTHKNPFPNMDSISSKSLAHNPALLSQEITNTTTWLIHARLGHVGSHFLKNLDVSRFKLPNLANQTSEFKIDSNYLTACEICNLCRQVERINRGSTPRSTVSLELIHSDTWGRCRVPGIFGSLYFVSFSDDATRESKIFVLKKLKEVSDCFIKYKEKKELQTNQRIKAMRFDGGSEYKSINFGGIARQVSAPYTQHQNGVSERLNRTIITIARYMLAHSGLPLRFWDAAVLTACYIRNRLPLLLEKRIPHEAMSGSKPEMSHFKRIYIPTKAGRNKIVTSANVRFFEDSFWDWSSHQNEKFDDADIPLQDDLDSTLNNFNRQFESDSETDEPASEILSSPPLLPLPVPPMSPQLIPSIDVTPTTQNLSRLTDTEEAGSTLTTHPSENVLTPLNFPSESFESNSNQVTPRRSPRTPKPIQPRSAWQPTPRALYVGGDISIPQSYKEAIEGPNSVEWQAAINEELASLQEKEVFSPITHVPHQRKPIGSR